MYKALCCTGIYFENRPICFYVFCVKQADLTRLEAAEVESLLANGRQRLDELIAGALNEDSADGVNRGGGVGTAAGGELMRLWEEGKEKLAELAGRGGEVRIVARCGEIDIRRGADMCPALRASLFLFVPVSDALCAEL